MKRPNYCTISSLTGKSYTVVRNGQVLEQIEVSHDDPRALPIINIEGPYRCPYHKNNRAGAACLTQAREIPDVLGISDDLRCVHPRRFRKKYRYCFRHLLLCEHTDNRSFRDDEPSRISGMPMYLQESGHTHWPDWHFQRNPKKCLMCSNLICDPRYHDPVSLWQIRLFDKIQQSCTVQCLRCATLITLGKWPTEWEVSWVPDSLGQRWGSDLIGADLSQITEKEYESGIPNIETNLPKALDDIRI